MRSVLAVVRLGSYRAGVCFGLYTCRHNLSLDVDRIQGIALSLVFAEIMLMCCFTLVLNEVWWFVVIFG